MNLTLELDSNQYKDLTRYCELNKFIPEEIAKKSYLEGFMIEKYGLLGNTGGVQEKEVIKEVVVEKRVEIPVEIIKEVVKVEYVEVPVEKVVTVEKPVERLVEVIKEVPVERVVEKIVEVTKEIPVEKVVIKEVVKEVPVEVVVTKTEYVSDDTQTNELLLQIQQLETEKQKFSTKLTETEGKLQIFSTKTTEMENIFQDKMSKKDEELDELRRNLDINSDDNKVKMLQQTVQNLTGQVRDLKKKNEELNKLFGDPKVISVPETVPTLKLPAASNITLSSAA